MAARATLKTVNDEMARRGYIARLAKASGYYFHLYLRTGTAFGAGWTRTSAGRVATVGL